MGNDQLYSYDIKTKKSQKLTDNLYGVNYIIPTTKKIFLVAAKVGEHNMSPSYYDIASKKLIDVEWDKDYFISVAKKDPSTEKIFVSGHSNKEDYDMMDKFNNEEIKGPYGIDNSIYQIDEESHKLIYKIENRYIDSFAINGENLICSTSLRGEEINEDGQTIIYNIKTKKMNICDDIIPGDLFYINDDGENVYSNTGNEIIKTELSSMKQESLLKLKNESAWINNAQF